MLCLFGRKLTNCISSVLKYVTNDYPSIEFVLYVNNTLFFVICIKVYYKCIKVIKWGGKIIVINDKYFLNIIYSCKFPLF